METLLLSMCLIRIWWTCTHTHTYACMHTRHKWHSKDVIAFDLSNFGPKPMCYLSQVQKKTEKVENGPLVNNVSLHCGLIVFVWSDSLNNRQSELNFNVYMKSQQKWSIFMISVELYKLFLCILSICDITWKINLIFLG